VPFLTQPFESFDLAIFTESSAFSHFFIVILARVVHGSRHFCFNPAIDEISNRLFQTEGSFPPHRRDCLRYCSLQAVNPRRLKPASPRRARRACAYYFGHRCDRQSKIAIDYLGGLY